MKEIQKDPSEDHQVEKTYVQIKNVICPSRELHVCPLSL